MLETKDWIYFSISGVLLLITLFQQIKLDRLEKQMALLSFKMLEVVLAFNILSKHKGEDKIDTDKEILND